MNEDKKIRLAQADEPIYLLPSMANRHGLIAGATGTGKTITMKVMAESFSDMGVPVFLDIRKEHRHAHVGTPARPWRSPFPTWACRCSLRISRAT